MSKLGKIMITPRHSVVVAKADISQVVAMPPDGNCVFAALAVGYKIQTASGTQLPPVEQRAAIGAMCRQDYLKGVRVMVAKKKTVLGLPIDSLLTDLEWTGVEEYLASMGRPIESRRQWGGYVEAAIMGHVWQMQVAFFLESHEGDVAMMTEPVGKGTRGPLLTQTRRALALMLATLQCDG